MIIFDSFSGRQYSDNPRAIYEYLKIHHPEYKMYWAANKHFLKNFENKEINIIVRFTPKWIYIMCRAKYWVSNSRFPLWFHKSSNTIYLQTWHGSPLKKLALDMESVYIAEHETNSYKKEFALEANRWNFLISPNQYSSQIFTRAFDFKNTLLEVGYPRNDFLINYNNKETINKIKRESGLPSDKKIILYAPTWRDNEYSNGRFTLEVKLDLYKMKQLLANDYIILLRLHYNVSHHIDLSDFRGFVYNFSSYEDIRSLYLISDLLITDYSSVFFDYAILQKPILFYVYDIEFYRDTLRGFYFDLEEQAPGPLLTTTDEVIQAIKLIHQKEFIINEKYRIFINKFCYLEDGKATERLIDNFFH